MGILNNSDSRSKLKKEGIIPFFFTLKLMVRGLTQKNPSQNLREKKRDKGILTLSLFFYIHLFSGKELISYYYLIRT